jgi:DNA-nicking Smr family endonuclease
MSNEDEENLFRSLYGDIERIRHDRVPEYRKKHRIKASRRPVATTQTAPDISAWPEISHLPAHGHESYTYQAGGIQNKVMQKLRRGQLTPEASIDLHGMKRQQALKTLQDFIHECRSRHITVIHVVHGKGFRSSGGKAVLKPSVAVWLKQIPGVLAYTPSIPRDGGEGALYVLLKR